jgi:hypothetical protein
VDQSVPGTWHFNVSAGLALERSDVIRTAVVVHAAAGADQEHVARGRVCRLGRRTPAADHVLQRAQPRFADLESQSEAALPAARVCAARRICEPLLLRRVADTRAAAVRARIQLAEFVCMAEVYR